MSISWRQDSVKEIREGEAAAAKAEAMNAQMQVAVMAFAATATTLSDEQALAMPDMFPLWEDVLAAGKKLGEGTILKDENILYRVVQTGGVIPQEHQPPHSEGMLAVYRPVETTHTGAADDPIPWVYGMDCFAGLYYAHNGHTYKVANNGDMIPCIWAPGTPGLWQWELIE